MLVPVIGLVQVGIQAMADRYTYLPQIGLYIALAWGAAHLAGSWPCRRRPLAAVAVLAVRADELCLAADAVLARQRDVVDPHLGLHVAETRTAHNGLGAWPTRAAGRGYRPVQQGIGNRPRLSGSPRQARYSLGRRGRLDEAIADYRKALEIKPDYAEAHNNLGAVLAGRGQADEAIAHFRKALEVRPDDAGDPLQPRQRSGRPRAGRGGDRPFPQGPGNQARLRRGSLQPRQRVSRPRAGRRGHRPFPARPWKSSPTMSRRTTTSGPLAGRGQVEEAIVQFRKALEIKPDHVEAHHNLALALVGRGQVDEAIEHYRKALDIKPDQVEVRYNLAMALASRGQVDEAIEHYQKALDLASARNERVLADRIRGPHQPP